jgi:hypothetical protein
VIVILVARLAITREDVGHEPISGAALDEVTDPH